VAKRDGRAVTIFPLTGLNISPFETIHANSSGIRHTGSRLCERR
jgi:hypothetical protein